MDKEVLFVASYFNNAHFIKYQYDCFLNIKNSFDFIVLNDASKDTKSLLNNINAFNEIKEECNKYNVIHVEIPQTIHDSVSNGGLVPDGLPVNHPTERHRATINYFLQNYKKLVTKKYKALVIVDADLFFMEDINIIDILGNNDIMGPLKQKEVLQDINNKDQYWPLKYKHITEKITIQWIWPILIILNLNTTEHLLEELNVGGFAGTDSGGLIHFFIKENNLKVGNISNHIDKINQNDIGYYNDEKIFIHYRAGSNWSYETKNYYFEKFYRLFEIHFPKYFIKMSNLNETVNKNEIVSRDKEHMFIDGKGIVILK